MTLCPKCHHPWRDHETVGWPTAENPNPKDECSVNMGMGTWCACKERRPEDWSNVEDVIEQVETGSQVIRTTRIGPRISGYLIELDDWTRLAAQLRRGE